jgi:anthranilate phosphoribosyltransferase
VSTPQPLRGTLETLLAGRSLPEDDACELLHALTDPGLAPAMAGALLAALVTGRDPGPLAAAVPLFRRLLAAGA